MKIEHVRVGGIYKIIADVADEDEKVILPKGNIVIVRYGYYMDGFVQVEDLTASQSSIKLISIEALGFLTLKDLYGELTPKEAPKQNKDSPSYNSHYANMVGLQPIEVMQEVMTREEFIGFLKGNIIKYTMRAGHKESEPAEKDVAKAKRYAQWLNQVRFYNKINPKEGGEDKNGTSEIQEACCGRCDS